MKKRISILLIMVMVAVLALSACGGGSDSGGGSSTPSGGGDGEVYEMKISVSPPDTNPVGMGVVYLGKLIEEKSGGRIKPEVFTGYELTSSDADQCEYTMNNVIQMSVCTPSTFVGYGTGLDEWYIFDYPYMFSTSEEVYAFCESDLFDGMRKELVEQTGIKVYAPYVQGWLKVSSNREPITSPQALAGLKIRSTTSQLAQEFLTACGAGATPMAWGEVFTGLQQGTIDGVATSTAMYDSDNLYEVQKYMATINPYAMLHMAIVNQSWYETLPEDLQKVVDECIAEYLVYVRDLMAKGETEILDTMEEKGMVVSRLSDAEIQSFKDATAYIIKDYAYLAGEDFVKSVQEWLGH